ncbi:MAG: NHL repeat-containing protein [Vulcanimicrobiaceae bacterium]
MRSVLRFVVPVTLAITLAAVPHHRPSQLPRLPFPTLFVSSMLRGIQGFALPLHSGEQGPTVLSVRSSASGMAIDAHNNLFVADAHGNEVDEFHWACPHHRCAWIESGSVATEKPAEDVAVDARGNVYVSESTNDAIQVFRAPLKARRQTLFKLAFPDTDTPNGVAVDASGNLYVAETERILEFHAPISAGSIPMVLMTNHTGASSGSPNGPYARGFAPSIAVLGNAIFIGMNPLPQDPGEIQVLMPPYIRPIAHLMLPAVGSDAQYLALDATGTLYVATQYGSETGKGGVYAFHAPFVGTLSPFAFVPTDDEGATGVAVSGTARSSSPSPIPILLNTASPLPIPSPLPPFHYYPTSFPHYQISWQGLSSTCLPSEWVPFDVRMPVDSKMFTDTLTFSSSDPKAVFGQPVKISLGMFGLKTRIAPFTGSIPVTFPPVGHTQFDVEFSTAGAQTVSVGGRSTFLAGTSRRIPVVAPSSADCVSLTAGFSDTGAGLASLGTGQPGSVEIYQGLPFGVSVSLSPTVAGIPLQITVPGDPGATINGRSQSSIFNFAPNGNNSEVFSVVVDADTPTSLVVTDTNGDPGYPPINAYLNFSVVPHQPQITTVNDGVGPQISVTAGQYVNIVGTFLAHVNKVQWFKNGTEYDSAVINSPTDTQVQTQVPSFPSSAQDYSVAVDASSSGISSNSLTVAIANFPNAPAAFSVAPDSPAGQTPDEIMQWNPVGWVNSNNQNACSEADKYDLEISTDPNFLTNTSYGSYGPGVGGAPSLPGVAGTVGCFDTPTLQSNNPVKVPWGMVNSPSISTSGQLLYARVAAEFYNKRSPWSTVAQFSPPKPVQFFRNDGPANTCYDINKIPQQFECLPWEPAEDATTYDVRVVDATAEPKSYLLPLTDSDAVVAPLQLFGTGTWNTPANSYYSGGDPSEYWCGPTSVLNMFPWCALYPVTASAAQTGTITPGGTDLSVGFATNEQLMWDVRAKYFGGQHGPWSDSFSATWAPPQAQATPAPHTDIMLRLHVPNAGGTYTNPVSTSMWVFGQLNGPASTYTGTGTSPKTCFGKYFTVPTNGQAAISPEQACSKGLKYNASSFSPVSGTFSTDSVALASETNLAAGVWSIEFVYVDKCNTPYSAYIFQDIDIEPNPLYAQDTLDVYPGLGSFTYNRYLSNAANPQMVSTSYQFTPNSPNVFPMSHNGICPSPIPYGS